MSLETITLDPMSISHMLVEKVTTAETLVTIAAHQHDGKDCTEFADSKSIRAFSLTLTTVDEEESKFLLSVKQVNQISMELLLFLLEESGIDTTDLKRFFE